MMTRRLWLPLIATSLAFWGAADLFAEDAPASTPGASAPKKAPVDFARDVFPILSDRCIDCHGPDVQEAKLRLDARDIVFYGGVSGPAVKRGHSAESLIWKRITSTDEKDRMPLDDDPLTDEQVALIRAWIDEGAVWPKEVGAQGVFVTKHWAYIKPVRPDVPRVDNSAWVRNPIDAFVLARMKQAGLEPAPESDSARLIRRLSLDLTGLPPTIEEIEAYERDQSPKAYEKLVDRLLASPRYGERWAIPWLDAARYADSNGYQRDGKRSYWAYRDWVVSALNHDMPFDEFTIEQIAGDLLPNATLEQKIATGFHRGTMANVEAGTDTEEERNLAIFDRVSTTATVWLGTTLGCAQCHNHKYDPFSQKEYYQLFAFFNNTEAEIKEIGRGREFVGPKIELSLAPKKKDQRDRVARKMEEISEAIALVEKKLDGEQETWEDQVAAIDPQTSWQTLEPVEYESVNGARLERLSDNSLLAAGATPQTDVYHVVAGTKLHAVTAFRVDVLADASLPSGGPGREGTGEYVLSEFKVEVANGSDPREFETVPIRRAAADASQKSRSVENAIDGKPETGWSATPKSEDGHHAVFVAEAAVPLEDGCVLKFTLDQKQGHGRTIGRFRLSVTDIEPSQVGLPANVKEILSTPRDKRSPKQRQVLTSYFRGQSDEFESLTEEKKRVQVIFDRLSPPTTLVMREMDHPRETHVYVRGNFLDKAESVQPATPRVLNPMPPDESPNRLTLAKWLVDEDNPLVARVTVNRQWAEFFGRGIVETLEDFGTQGQPPTHPELLDWLATEFVRRQWSLKAIHRLIVTSATYRQSSRVTPELLAKDPYNRWYARGPRRRLTAELVRDDLLFVSGLLSNKMGGPPVFPVQPDGVWNHIGVASNVWTTSKGEDLYRRGLYIYWRRTVPYPSLVNFDAPSRETCTVNRSKSNTPLQALTLMNDPVFFEAATALAGRLLSDCPPDAGPEDRAAYGFRLVTSRNASLEEIGILLSRYESELARYRSHPEDARKLVSQWKVPDGVDVSQFAAWIHVANVLLNLDESITRG